MAKATLPEVGSIVLGSEAAIVLSAENSGYVHTLKYSFGSASGTIAEKVGAGYTWDVPLDLASQIPTAARGAMALTCETYGRDGAFIGSETISVEATVPDDERTKPEVSMGVTLVNDLPDPFIGLYITKKTKLKVTFIAAGKYGADITGYKSHINMFPEISYENPATLVIPFALHSDAKLTGEITDSRGFVQKVYHKFNVISYSEPSVIPYTGEEKVICCRCDQDGTVNRRGEYLLIKAGCSCYPVVSDGVRLNYCALRFRYKEYGAETYSEWRELISQESGDNEVFAVQEGIQLGKNAYEVQLQAIDTIGESRDTIVRINETKAQLHLGKGGKNVAIGQYCDYSHEDSLDIGYTAWFNAGVGKRTIFEGVEWNLSTATSFGNPITDVTQDANLPLIENYTLLVAVFEDGYPELCVKHDLAIRGSSLVMAYKAPDSLLLVETEKTVVALYAII